MSTAALKILEGGKSPGRPNREQAEANRQETHTKLRALGMYDAAVEYASNKGMGLPEKWNTKKCNDVLAWAREQAGVILCKCGQPAKHYDSDEGENAVALCEACYAKEQAQESPASIHCPVESEREGEPVTVYEATCEKCDQRGSCSSWQ